MESLMQVFNLTQLSTRVRNKVEEKKRLVSALTAGVSPEGQKLYMAITKTIPGQDQVSFDSFYRQWKIQIPYFLRLHGMALT